MTTYFDERKERQRDYSFGGGGDPIQKLLQRTKPVKEDLPNITIQSQPQPQLQPQQQQLSHSPPSTPTSSKNRLQKEKPAQQENDLTFNPVQSKPISPIKKTLSKSSLFKSEENLDLSMQLIRCQSCAQLKQVEKYCEQLKNQVVNAIEDSTQFQIEYQKIKDENSILCNKYDDSCKKLRTAASEYNSLNDLHNLQVNFRVF